MVRGYLIPRGDPSNPTMLHTSQALSFHFPNRRIAVRTWTAVQTHPLCILLPLGNQARDPNLHLRFVCLLRRVNRQPPTPNSERAQILGAGQRIPSHKTIEGNAFPLVPGFLWRRVPGPPRPAPSCPVLSVTAASPAPSLEASSPPQPRSAQILPPKNSHFWRVTGLGFQPNPPCAFSGQLLFPGCLLIIKAASQPEATAKILATCIPLLIGFSCTR